MKNYIEFITEELNIENITLEDIDEMIKGYIDTALYIHDDDNKFKNTDIEPSSRLKIKTDIVIFISKNKSLLKKVDPNNIGVYMYKSRNEGVGAFGHHMGDYVKHLDKTLASLPEQSFIDNGDTFTIK